MSQEHKSLSPKIVEGVLKAGGWSPTEDDTMQRERLPHEFVKDLIQSYPSDKRSIGLLSLTLAAAKWGVEDDGSLPDDPADDAWRGPTRASGKHLMSYLVGGVGLPHLDVGPLAKFIDYLVEQHSYIGSASERDFMATLAEGLRHKKVYDQIKTDATFRKWMLQGLRRIEAQQWILEYWLTSFWEPAYNASGADIRLAMILARIWNTRKDLGEFAAEKARQAEPDQRVEAALHAYAFNPKGNPDYERRRWGWMRRPVVLLDKYWSAAP
ncbi:hypothetical protein [Sinorhizobium meliloti]|uniref:hypothetical protein n=1 Tax=Rhizobium meliloti TaxID=382 RepID=UPI0004813ED9|nr:hypothetical protein [Sinorhizobium meliloti]